MKSVRTFADSHRTPLDSIHRWCSLSCSRKFFSLMRQCSQSRYLQPACTANLGIGRLKFDWLNDLLWWDEFERLALLHDPFTDGRWPICVMFLYVPPNAILGGHILLAWDAYHYRVVEVVPHSSIDFRLQTFGTVGYLVGAEDASVPRQTMS